MSSFATPEAIEIIYDVFATTFKAEISDVPNITTSIAYQPMTKRFVEEGDRRGGNPQGIDASKAPYFCMSHLVAAGGRRPQRNSKSLPSFLAPILNVFLSDYQLTMCLFNLPGTQGSYKTYHGQTPNTIKELPSIAD